jgi:hypothetical protein
MGPFYMIAERREEMRYDKKKDMKEISLSKDELMRDLKEVGTENPPGTKDKQHDKLSVLNHIPPNQERHV